MAGEWQESKVIDVAQINTATYSTNEKWEYVNYLDTSNITNGQLAEVQLISDLNSLPSRARRKVQIGDIVYSTVRPNQRHYGIIKKPNDNMLVSTGFAVLRGKNQILDTKFLYYFLIQDHIVEKLQTIAEHSTSAYPSIRPSDIGSLELGFPPLSEQQAIACILGTLDDKIELNRQMNKTLEEMARAIFKSWFVDFLPVRAKMAARTQAGGLKPEIAALFPDSFEPACRGGHGAGRDSKLGEIPRGWSIIEVGGIGNVVCGKTPPTKDSENYGGEIPFITIPDMHGKVFVTSTASSLSEKGAGTQSAKLLPKYAVCVSCIATPGLVSITSQPSHTNQQINSIICYKDISPFWCYFAMKSLRYEIITGGSGGSATLNLNKGDFSKLRLIKPKPDIMHTFHATVNPLFARILNNEYESRTLTALRDTLLPRLISGELRVPDAERIIGRAI